MKVGNEIQFYTGDPRAFFNSQVIVFMKIEKIRKTCLILDQ